MDLLILYSVYDTPVQYGLNGGCMPVHILAV